MSKIYFTADTHFGDDSARIRSRRPFKDVKEMNYILVSNWNCVVRNDDIVYHLGDFGDYEYVKKLNGKVILVYGNHEHRDPLFNEDPEKFIKNLQGMGFYGQHVQGHTILPMATGEKLLLAHKPSIINEIDFPGSMLFGHIHEFQKLKTCGMNVGVDVNYFTPVDEETIRYYLTLINLVEEELF